MNFWLIQAIGAVALVFVFLAWNAKTRKNILLLQSVNLVLFVIHYFLLSAFAGAAMCLVVLGRNIVLFKKNEKAWASHWSWFYIFTLIALGVLAVSWNGWITILPVAAVILSMYAMWKDNPVDIRFYMLLVCLIWVPYTIVVQSYSGLLSQVVGIAGILVGMYRHDREKSLGNIL